LRAFQQNQRQIRIPLKNLVFDVNLMFNEKIIQYAITFTL
jgi:hypothetical protein